MQGKLAKFSLLAITALALPLFSRCAGRQPIGPARDKETIPGGAVYEDTRWSRDEDIQPLKSNLLSQEKPIVATNMDLTDAEVEKFWPVCDRCAAELTKIYDTKIVLFRHAPVTIP